MEFVFCPEPENDVDREDWGVAEFDENEDQEHDEGSDENETSNDRRGRIRGSCGVARRTHFFSCFT